MCWRELPSACSSRWGIYYGLRGMGVDVYVALLVSTLMSAAPTVVGLFRRRVNALSAYFTTMVLGSVVVVPGSR